MDQYLLPAAVVIIFIGWRWAHGMRIRKTLSRLLAEGAPVVDVRSTGEFARAHAPGSINVPLAQLATSSLAADPDRSIIVCCASGTRSGIAKGILRRRSFRNVVNGGSWVNVARSRDA